jgi:ABC-type phosphate transport system substrate-binding protein
MPRSTATALLLLMLAAFLAPAALATATNPTPACCRTTGPHRCSATVPGGTDTGLQVQGQSCPYRKTLTFSGSAAPPPVTETVALADARPSLNDFYPELFVSQDEQPHPERAPPLAR